MSHRPGLLLMLGALALARPASGAAQISPGALARPHRALEGALQCLKCHPVGRKDAMDGACQDCHKEIAWLRAERRGLHGKETIGRCASCHPDHAGADFSLIAWNADSLRGFDHRRTGYRLEGAHTDLKCDACHKQANRVGQAARLAPAGAKPTWWIGLETSCSSCHEDSHRGRIKAPCTDCHTTEAWAPAPRFDHATTDYPLTGKHQDVACRQCHTARSGTVKPGMSELDPGFPALRFPECSGCHRDPHQARLGAVCSDCHVTSGFAQRPAGGFDHSRTRYALEGRHATVACAACHGTGARRRNPGFESCASCHKDSHDSSATVAAKVRDCASCHTVNGFKPSSFGVQKHEQGRCQDCHLESHAAQPARLQGVSGCGSCHRVTSWTTSSYSVELHKAAGLPLEGRHAAATCGACHSARRADLPPLTRTDSLGPARVLFKLGSVACASCHSDPHRSRYQEACTACHTAQSFRPSTMDLASHAQRGFALDGAHRAVPCAACHESLTRPAGGAALLQARVQPAPMVLTTDKKTCAACHPTPHGDQFRQRADGRCEACHGEDGFKPASRFDHDRDAAFSLKGAHKTVACSQCHPTELVDGQAPRVRYRPVPTTCESCHPAKPEQPHAGGVR
jgi:hypothetical protein